MAHLGKCWRCCTASTAFGSCQTAKFLLVNVSADLRTLYAAFLLVIAKVNPAVNTRVIDVVRDLAQAVVVQLQNDAGTCRSRESDPVRPVAENSRQDLARRVTRACVGRRIAGKASRHD